MKTNNSIIRKSTLTTDGVTAGLLNPEQSRKFLRQAFDATPLGQLVRHEMRTAKTGEIDKIGIASRILRKKTENTDDNYRAKPDFSKIEYATTAVRLPWEITEETLRENIEGQGLEATITDLMTRQLGVDLEDIYLNGDEAIPDTDGDYDFLKINNGWIKQILQGGHVEDRTSIGSGAMSIDVYYDALQKMPNKYNNGTLRWLMSPRRKQEWERYLIDKLITVGAVSLIALLTIQRLFLLSLCQLFLMIRLFLPILRTLLWLTATVLSFVRLQKVRKLSCRISVSM